MPFRLLEVTIPAASLEEVPSLVEDMPVVHMHTMRLTDDLGLINILLEAQHVETISDLLVTHFGSEDNFRLIILPVEATLPEITQSSSAQNEADNTAEKTDSGRISREELYEDIAQSSRLTITYLVMVAVSTLVAAIGLIRGDVAIIIGAMVIAPLLGPNIALSLAVTLGDLDLAKQALKAVGTGVAIAMAFAMLVGIFFPVDPGMPELAARTHPELSDVVLALAAGIAGSLAFTTGVPAVVVGVMVAVALLPPLVATGLLMGSGFWSAAAGSFTLLFTNVTCINLAAVATFFFQQVSPRTWWEADRAKKSMRIAVSLWLFMLGLLVALILSGRVGTD